MSGSNHVELPTGTQFSDSTKDTQLPATIDRVEESQLRRQSEVKISQTPSSLGSIADTTARSAPQTDIMNTANIVQGCKDSTSDVSDMESPNAFSKAYVLRHGASAPHRIRLGNPSRIYRLLAALPRLKIEQMPIPTRPPLEKFELFEKLPQDIRVMIYKLMVSEPRYVKLKVLCASSFALTRS